jgi:hypothetical protein
MVEVKASRAVFKGKGSYCAKAIPISSGREFVLKFQQLRPFFCNVFVWVAVWTDAIRYWVLSTEEVQALPFLSTQHSMAPVIKFVQVRSQNLGDLNPFMTEPEDLGAVILQKANGKSLPKPISIIEDFFHPDRTS